MEKAIRNKIEHLIMIKKNPLADLNNINRLKKDLEWINVANFSPQDMQLLSQVME